MCSLVQPIPMRMRHGIIKAVRLRFRPVGSNEFSIQTVSDLTAVAANLTLSKDVAYEVFVDANTTEGFNETLSNLLPPLIIPEDAQGK